MRKLLIIVCALLLTLPMTAQKHANIVEAMQDNVTLHQDSSITRLLQEKIEGAEREEVQIAGYRVQIYSSNRQQTAKTEAMALEKMIQEAELQVPVYVQYTPPFWKVRLGDFRTQEEARILKEDIVRRFPNLTGDTYVVRDQITVVKQRFAE